MSRLIEVDKIFDGKLLMVREEAYDAVHAIIEKINNAPSVDAEPVRHGHWEYSKRNHNSCYGVCSVCKKGTTFFFKNGTDYCPFCGAKMDEVV